MMHTAGKHEASLDVIAIVDAKHAAMTRCSGGHVVVTGSVVIVGEPSRRIDTSQCSTRPAICNKLWRVCSNIGRRRRVLGMSASQASIREELAELSTQSAHLCLRLDSSQQPEQTVLKRDLHE
jgi:hypothetical protein